jgi:L-amino acid N-acyltransferase
MFSVRTATAADVSGIRAIYNYAIKHLIATFDTDEKSLADRQAWLSAHDAAHPVFVAVDQDRVLGWASLSPFSDRLAYARTVETSIYVEPSHLGQGIGTALMQALMTAAREHHHHCVIAKIAGGNNISVRLHQRFGFVVAGTLHQVGWKFDAWHDVLMMECVI